MIHLTTIRQNDNSTENAYDDEFAPVGENWNYCPGELVTVKCYTNADRIELFSNDNSLGTYEKDAGKDCITTTVAFEPGTLTAKATINDIYVSHRLYTTTAACQISVQEYRLAPEITDLIAEAVGQRNPIHQLEVTLCDGNGRRVYQDATLLTVSVRERNPAWTRGTEILLLQNTLQTYRRAYPGPA